MPATPSRPSRPPLYVVSTEEMRRIESASNERGHTFDDMMRLAGAGVARAVDEEMEAGVVVALCGPGNNGGDALVASGLLKVAGHDVRVVLWNRDATAALPEVDGQLGDAPVLTASAGTMDRVAVWLAEADAVIDGLLGTGMTRPIEGDLADLLDLVRQAAADGDGPLVVAVDVPTGLDSDSGALDPHTVPADLCVTFGFPKHGALRYPGAGAVGELVVEDIGLAEDLYAGQTILATERLVASLLPDRPADAHKGTFGRLLLVAGSVQYTGAAALAAAAAYRVGCGLVTAAVGASVRQVLATLAPEVTFVLLPEDLGVIGRPAALLVQETAAACDALVLGPGLTTHQPAVDFMGALLQGGPPASHARSIGFEPGGAVATGTDPGGKAPGGLALPMVLDADGLSLVGAAGMEHVPAACVLTPHPGEMARLTGQTVSEIQADRLSSARAAAERWRRVVVLKGALTVVAAPDGRAWIMPFANAALAKAGTGDVLAGALGGFLAQGLSGVDAAVAAAYTHGLAGELAASALGARAVTASDVAVRLGRALEQIEAAG